MRNKKKGFTQVENFILYSPLLEPQVKALYIIIRSYCYDFPSRFTCFPTEELLGKNMNRTDRMVREYLKELEKYDLIRINKYSGEKHNTYTILKPELFLRNWTSSNIGNQLPSYTGNVTPTNNTEINKTKKNKLFTRLDEQKRALINSKTII